MSTIVSSQSSNKKFLLTGAAVVAVAVAAYGLGRVYPPLGPTEGTVAPAQTVARNSTEPSIAI